MDLKEHHKMVIESLTSGTEVPIVLKSLVEAGMQDGKAALCIRIAQHQILESEHLEKAIQEALNLLDDGAAIKDLTITMMAAYGMFIGAKATHHACLRKGIENPSSKLKE